MRGSGRRESTGGKSNGALAVESPRGFSPFRPGLGLVDPLPATYAATLARRERSPSGSLHHRASQYAFGVSRQSRCEHDA